MRVERWIVLLLAGQAQERLESGWWARGMGWDSALAGPRAF
jgi:hypothetical protein